MSTMKEKMHMGEPYLLGDEEIMGEQLVYQDKLCEYKGGNYYVCRLSCTYGI